MIGLLIFICATMSFVIGSIPFGWIVGRLKGIDIRKIGSGNIGAMNVGRVIGPKGFIAVFLLDAIKGFIPTILAGKILLAYWPADGGAGSLRDLSWLMIGLCTVLGHNYSLFFGFRGGKGVATSFGVALGIYPELTYPALIGLGVWVLGIGITRMSSVGSLSAGIIFPVAYVLLARRHHDILGENWPFLAFTLLASVMLLVRHRANIARIWSGTEPRMGSPSGKKISTT